MAVFVQPSHLYFMFLIGAITLFTWAPALIAIRIARGLRARCSWTMAKAKRRLVIGALLIIVGPLIPLATRIPPTSAIAISAWVLVWVGAFQVARGVYRKRDLESANKAAPVSATEQSTAR